MSTHNPIAQPRWVALAALTLVAVGSLSGCGLAFSEPDASPAPPASSPQTPSTEPADDDPAESPAESPEESDPTEIGAPSAERDELIARAQQTVPCSAGLDVANDGAIIRVEGACDELTVSADAAIVIADDVTTLTVSGSGSVVYALELADLRISGDVNEVRWTGATPAVTDDGTANTIGQQR
ncbi:DUF3060 domain-containing protein [Agrococcus jejuensis]|uniref:DUF3060 domain-containing protein n=1 Tax=Agrococcus jejuensis TaxID=399736 RepID=A0A1G8EB60_9MICO|nr:DUF3060 domain-containing protein [Agrococcus jejuensis]SDH67148.1 Protein of unknown function [Agrococcus jejuensis]